MLHVSENIKRYLSHFADFEKGLNGETKSPIHTIRKNAIEQFSKLGFPTTKNEEWRFTDIKSIASSRLTPSFQKSITNLNENHLKAILIQNISGPRLVFINGIYSRDLSKINISENKLQISSLAEAIKNQPEFVHQFISQNTDYLKNPFTALNTSFIQEGAMIAVPERISSENQIYLVFISCNSDESLISQPRNIIVVGDDSRLSIVEHYVSASMNSNFTNTVTDIVVGKNSSVEHIKIQNESPKTHHVGSIYFSQDVSSNVTSYSITIGGELVRNNVTSTLNAKECECSFNGLSVASGQQLIDNHTTIDHTMPHCNSHELFKAILGGKSKGIFNGKIFVRRDAQKTDAKQTNKTLLLSDAAMMNTKPQLEIFADDVKCTHGATIGYLDADAIFYLRARGISEETARDILTHAFANDIINRISFQPIREHINHFLNLQLKQGRQLENL